MDYRWTADNGPGSCILPERPQLTTPALHPGRIVQGRSPPGYSRTIHCFLSKGRSCSTESENDRKPPWQTCAASAVGEHCPQQPDSGWWESGPLQRKEKHKTLTCTCIMAATVRASSEQPASAPASTSLLTRGACTQPEEGVSGDTKNDRLWG